MRKHLLRILTVLLIVCFGACLFAACNDDEEKPDDAPATYTLTYNANGGSGNDVTESHKEGDKVTLKGADTFSYEGHTFTGWNDGSKTYAAAAEFTMPAKNVTMKAQWETKTDDPPAPKTYTVTMAANANVDFKIVEPADKTSFEKDTVVKFTVTPKTGYTVRSVKNGTTEVPKGTDGKYSVTVGEANIVITVETEAEQVTPQKYTVTVSGDHVTPAFDAQGPYAEGTTVKFTLTVENGFEIESVKNGTADVPKGTDGKYFVTVGKANITITVTTKSTTPAPSGKALKDFDRAWVAQLGTNGVQVIFTFKADGITTEQAMKDELKLVIGEAAGIAPVTATPDANGGPWTVYFNIQDLSAITAAKTQLKLMLGTTPYENIAAKIDPAAGVKVGNNTYTLTIGSNKLYLNVAAEQGGVDPPVETDTTIEQTGDLIFYAENFFKLPVSADDYAWIVEKVAYITVDGDRPVFQNNKGFNPDGNVIQINAVGAKADDTTKNEWEIVWYDAQGKAIAKTTAKRNWEPAPREGITYGGEGDSINYWIYWKDETADAVTVTDVTLDEDEIDGATVTAKFRSNTCTLDYGFQIFYNNMTDYKIGTDYTLTLTVTAKSDMTVKINGQLFELKANEAKKVSVKFNYNFHTDNVVNYDYGTSLFDVQIPLKAETDYNVTFAGIRWAETPKIETQKGASVGKPDTTKALIVSGKNDTTAEDDQFMIWWVQSLDYNSGDVVTMTPAADNIGSALENGKISFSYTGGNRDYSVQLFYKETTKLKQNTTYYICLDIKLSECDTLTIKVNGKPQTLTKGENHVEVLFEHWYNYDENRGEWDRWQGCYGVDIQFPGTNAGTDAFPNTAVPGGKVGLEISNIEWFEATVAKTVTFRNAEIEAEGDTPYLVLYAFTTGYTVDELKTAKIYEGTKTALTVNESKSQLKVNDESVIYFDLSVLTADDTKQWYFAHLKFGDTPWNGADGNGDVKPLTIVSTEAKILNYKSYRVRYDDQGWGLLVIEINDAHFLSASLKLENNKVYYVVDAYFAEKDLTAAKTAVLYNGNDTYAADQSKTVLVEGKDHEFLLYFDITALGTGTFYPHIKFGDTPWNGANGNGDVNCGAGETASVSTATKTYTIEVTDYNMPTVKVTEPAPEVKTTVKFNVGEGASAVQDQSYAEGNTFTAPAAPTKTNYKFLYWYYLNGDDEVKVETGFVPSDHDDDTHTLTLYAKWEFDVKVGKADFSQGYPGNVTSYVDKIEKGQIATFRGTFTSEGKSNPQAPLMFIYSEGTEPWGCFRADWAANFNTGMGTDANEMTVATENWKMTKYLGPSDWTTWLATLKSAKVSLTFDWSHQDTIYVCYQFLGDNGLREQMVYSIVATQGNTLKASYAIGLNAESSYIVLNERIVSEGRVEGVYNELKVGTKVTFGDAATNAGTRHYAYGNYIAQGEKIVFEGTQTANISTLDNGTQANWESNGVAISSSVASAAWFRSDNFVDGMTTADENVTHDFALEGWHVTKDIKLNNGEINWDTFKTVVKSGSVKIVLDWTTATTLKIEMTFTKDTNTIVQTYSITASAGKTLAKSYNFFLGYNLSSANLEVKEAPTR